jgi:heme-degrading monooxygenase HmoA
MDDGRRLERDDPRPARTMIVRSWSARLEPRKMPEYLAHLDGSVKPAIRALPGFLGMTVLRRQVEPASLAMSEVVVQTRWASLDAIHAFAGADISHAVVEPEAAALFTEYDRRVLHYEVVG